MNSGIQDQNHDGSGPLTDSEVVRALMAGDIVITPLFSPLQVGMTVDLRLGTSFGVRKLDRLSHFDPVEFLDLHVGGSNHLLKCYEVSRRVNPMDPFILHPGKFVLACTLEHVVLKPYISGVLEGRSGWAREGLNVHSTASFIHPGHNGSIVFELSNVGSHSLPLHPGTRVAQIRFTRHRYPNSRPYGTESHHKYKNPTRSSGPAGVVGGGDAGHHQISDSRLSMFGRPWSDLEFERIAAERKRRASGANPPTS